MKTIIHKNTDREKVNFGWLNSYHSFSFGQYYDAEKIHFGALRVLNDDTIKGGTGFGKHPHDNMEIISIPLSGALEHQDSTGTKAVIMQNDVQIMSAGTGIQHSEKNHSATEETNFLQIWIIPKKNNIAPRYDQKTFDPSLYENKILQVVAPDNKQAVWINQDTWLSLFNSTNDQTTTYTIQKPGNGVYVFVLEGSIKAGCIELATKDAMGIWDTDTVTIEAAKGAKVLFIDVPMILN